MSLKDQLKIMVVDDMTTSRGLIEQAMNEIGIWNVVSEADGQSAFRTLMAKPVHLVISDYNMPNMDGLQLLEQLRLSKATARIGFILVTGRADNAVLQKGRQLGMNNCLLKPFSVPQMKACIEKVVGRL
ncbi:response regulator [Pelagimonas sp. KU-00592-HH]|jgi:two-component system chemotaxis response regulator CheY|uniref:response regulator n=1 Tax=Roseobacteraceae TaxID=2854170 RepID=UPI0020CF4F61|nr:response regulator [Shimia sp. CNT1-13L.2]MCP9483213.1 response regulator [Shimia sp. CNT1-13L.2]